MDEETALRQIRKLWKGSGLRIESSLKSNTVRGCEQLHSMPGSPCSISSTGAKTSTVSGHRRRSLADFGTISATEEIKEAQEVDQENDTRLAQEAEDATREALLLIGVPPSGSVSQPRRRLDIGIVLERDRSATQGMFMLGKPSAKKRAACLASGSDLAVVAVQKNVSTDNASCSSTPLEKDVDCETVQGAKRGKSQKVARARQLEDPNSHASVIMDSIQAWRGEQLAGV